MTKWESHHAPRAVVPPASILNSANVIKASTELAQASPSAFGIGISRISHLDPSIKQPLPLYYVSQRVASERCADCNADSASGVKAGWYVVAEPDAEFEIYISPLRGDESVKFTAPDGTIVTAKVWIDDTLAKSQHTVFDPKEGSLCEKRLKGFREEWQSVEGGGMEMATTFRKFVFYKPATTGEESREEVEEESVFRRIRLCLWSAVRGPVKKMKSEFVEIYDAADVQAVSEKDAAKRGLSVAVRRDSELKNGSSVVYGRHMLNRTALPCCEVTIYLREHFWMLSRGIIDMDGRPVKTFAGEKERDEEEEKVIDVDEWCAETESYTEGECGGKRRKTGKEVIVLD